MISREGAGYRWQKRLLQSLTRGNELDEILSYSGAERHLGLVREREQPVQRLLYAECHAGSGVRGKGLKVSKAAAEEHLKARWDSGVDDAALDALEQKPSMINMDYGTPKMKGLSNLH